MAEVLEGIRVVDLTTGPVGGFATMVLADFGADVIKVEPPGGDRFRTLAASPLWLRGKRSVVLDLAAEDGLARLRDLVRGADVLVISGPPDRAARWGVDAAGAERLQPTIVHCSITGWGGRGPFAGYPGYDALVAARGGRMLAFERQLRRGGPVFAGVAVASHTASQGAVQGIVAGLIAKHRNGRAQRVETSLLQGLLPYDLTDLLITQLNERTGESRPSFTAMGGDMPTLNYHPILAADGRWIQCGNLLEHLFLSFLDALGLLEEMLIDERFGGSPADWDANAIEAARDLILLRTQEKKADEWMDIFRRNANVAAEVFLMTDEALRHPDAVANGDIVSIEDPVHGLVRTLGPIAQLRATPAVIGRPAPRVGEHTDEVLAEIIRPPETSHTSPAPWVGAPLPAGQPLAGVVVVEFATIIAAPLSTVLLADLGARVIRVEVIEGDAYRHLMVGGGTAAKTTAGKESICVDLKSAPGRAIARRLVAGADVLVHNFRPGVAERLGIGYDELRAGQPGLVWVALNGYGPDSPGTNRPATHPCAGAAMGGAGYQGGDALTRRCASLADVRESARQLMRANESNPDPNTSVVAASAVIMALLARERHGMGQAVYVNMLAANAYANGDDFLDYASKAPRPVIDAEMYGTNACYRLYRAASGWVFLALTTDAEWDRFCGLSGFAPDARFVSAASRSHHDTSLAGALEQWFVSRDADDWEALLAPAGVGCVRADAALPGPFFAHDPQMIANEFAPYTTHTRFGRHRRWGPIVTVDGPADAYGPGVLAGEQTDALLGELGYSPDQITELYAAKVVASEAP